MKLKKAGLAILTGSILMSTLYGCGGNPEGVADNSQKNNKDVSQNTVQSQGGNSTQSTGEATDITVVLRTLGTVEESASEAVEEAVNEITKRELNINVDLIWVDSAKYETQVPMMIYRQ